MKLKPPVPTTLPSAPRPHWPLSTHRHARPRSIPSLASMTNVNALAAPGWAQDVTPNSLSSWLARQVVGVRMSNAKELEQSECCQLRVEVQADNTASSTGPEGEHEVLEVLLKRYHLRRLMQRVLKPDEKWRISAQSFTNEHEFLQARGVLRALQGFLQPHAGLPTVYYTHGVVSESDWFDRQYDFIFEFLSPSCHHQSSQLDLPEALAAMTLLARFHAFFWRSNTQHPQGDTSGPQHPQEGTSGVVDNTTQQGQQASGSGGGSGDAAAGVQGDGVEAADQWAGVFSRGAWWRKQLRPSVRYARIPEALQGLCAAFPGEELFGGDLATPEAHQAMCRLRDSVDTLTDALTNAPDRTLVHGDCKTSNIFFRAAPNGIHPGQQQPSGQWQAYAIDFQWTGRAPSGMADVVYCLYGGVAHDVLLHHEAQLLDTYQHHLHAALRERGMDPHLEAHRSWLDTHLALETLAYWATALPQLLDGLTPQMCDENRDKYGWLTHEMDARSAALLARRALHSLHTVEAAGGIAQVLQKHSD